jgi:hypothetical protein
MKTDCRECAKPLDPRNKSGLCKPCLMHSGMIQAKRVATLASQSSLERMSRFRIVRSDGECWGWRGCHNGVGYPVLRINKKLRVATQIALELDGRLQPSPRHVACHSCDNPICTNPAHLWWGTKAENTQDGYRKGRIKTPTERRRTQGFLATEVRHAA